MPKGYPRQGGMVPAKQLPGRSCEGCGKPAKGGLLVQFDYMRGNDEVYAACDGCRGLKLDAFLRRVTEHAQGRP